MFLQRKTLGLLRENIKTQIYLIIKKSYSMSVPFIELFEQTTNETLSQDQLAILKKKHLTIDVLSHDKLQNTLQTLDKFNISALEACKDPHVFCMNPISMDNYGEILKECGFVKIIPKYIIRYQTLVRSRTIQQLKKEGLLPSNLNLVDRLQKCFELWPVKHIITQQFPDTDSSILTIRMFVLEKYLNWKLNVSPEDFQKYCRLYLPIKHRPMSDIQKALQIAEHEIGFSTELIRRNGFLISADPANTQQILTNVPSIAGLDIREAIRIEPAILKNNYNNFLAIRTILEEYRISEEAQKHCLKIYCMCPKTVKERLKELSSLKEYQVLKTNSRVLSMVVHKRKIMNRLSKMQAANKQCYSLNQLISSNKIFNNYIGSFGSKICGRDIATLICSSLKVKAEDVSPQDQTASIKLLQQQLKRHKFWLHTNLNVVHENIEILKKMFNDEAILNNCHLLLYPVSDLQQYLQFFVSKRKMKEYTAFSIPFDTTGYNNLKYGKLTDEQTLSLILYEIERKYHFTGDGIWSKSDTSRVESPAHCELSTG